MWSQPWTFREGTALSVGLLLVGAMLQMSVGPVEWRLFVWPANIVALCLLVVLLVMAYILREKVYAFRFLTTVYAAVPALACAALFTVVMGLTKQVADGHAAKDLLGITRMLSFWPFVLIYFWMTIIIGELAIVQATRFSWQRLPSFLCHTGLFVVLTCGTLGSADMQKLKMYCTQGKPEWRGIDDAQNMHELPLAIELQQFSIDEYAPKLVIIDEKGVPLPEAKKPAELHLEDGIKSENLLGWTISVVKSLPDGVPVSLSMMRDNMPAEMMSMMKMDSLGLVLNKGGYVAWDKPGSAYVVEVVAKKGNTVRRGWVTCGSYMFPYEGLRLDAHHTLAMPQREPRRYASRIQVLTKDGENVETTVEVNHPYSIAGWKIYQLSYNEQMGKWSDMSVFELVTDPWLPAVYAGIYLLLFGAIFMFVFAGRKKK
ncbi:MAG: cytochrome c biogenesis protein ResB [Prevotella sp.]|nr:cytochrome c biogenesis protein ResB [Prevotella sp.]